MGKLAPGPSPPSLPKGALCSPAGSILSHPSDFIFILFSAADTVPPVGQKSFELFLGLSRLSLKQPIEWSKVVSGLDQLGHTYSAHQSFSDHL